MHCPCLWIFESDIVLSISVLSLRIETQAIDMYSSCIQVKCIFVMYRLSLWKDCTARSLYSSLFMSELLNHNIKRVSYVLTHNRKE